VRIRFVRRKNGEQLPVHQTDDGVYLCPICGFPVSDVAPYEDTYRADGASTGDDEPFATPSYEKCDSCGTYYGETDLVLGDASLQERWRELRRSWLDRVGWSASAREQLQNLGIEVTRPT
jgi:hypothetical protein